MNMMSIAASVLCGGALVLAGCTSANGPAFSAYQVSRPNGEQAYRVSCHGFTGGREVCYAKAKEICDAVKQPVSELEAEAPFGAMVNGQLDTRVLIFRCAPAVPSTPAPAAQPAPQSAGTIEQPIRMTLSGDTLFETDRTTLRPAGIRILNNMLSDSAQKRFDTIKISGHADGRGSDAYNLRLSERRAQAVAQYLKAQGISADHFDVQWFGKARPVASNATPEGRAMNRRVEIELIR